MQEKQHTRSTWVDAFERSTDALRFWDLFVGQIANALGPIRSVDLEAGSVTLDTGGVIRAGAPATEINWVEPADWPHFIAWWIDQLADLDPRRLIDRFADWEAARPNVVMRVTGPLAGIVAVERPLTRTLRWALHLQIPNDSPPLSPSEDSHRSAGPTWQSAPASMVVTPELLADWAVPAAHVWQTAADNARRRQPPERIDVIAAERHFRLLEGDLFATAVLDDLSDIVPEIGGDGALVAVPTSDAVLVQPIDGWIDVGEDAARLLIATLRFQEVASHLLPPAVLWYRGPGSLTGAVDLADRPAPDGLPFAIDIVADEPLRSALAT